MQKNNQDPKRKGFLKSLVRGVLYIAAFLALVFISLSVSSYFWLEEQKMDMSDVMSFEQFENSSSK